MINFTTCANVANSFLKVLQGYTKGIRLIALLTMLCTIGVGQMWAADVVCDFTAKSAGHSAYTDSWKYGDFTVFGGANNNNGWAYVKMGGKKENLSSANPVYISSPKIASSVSKVQVSIIAGSLAKSGMSVNSWGVYVYSDANMTNQIDYVAGGTITKNAAIFELTPSSGSAWSANNYYKVSFDLVNTTTTNGIIWLDKITFVEASGGGSDPTPVDPTATFSNGEYTVGGAALDLSTLWESNSDGAVTYSVKTDGGTGASINGASFTATAAGSCTVQASQAAATGYNAITKEATITVNAAQGGDPDPGAGETGTLVITRASFPSGSLTYNTTDNWSATASTGETVSGQGDLYSTANQTTMQTKNSSVSTHYHNTTAMPGAISKISVEVASGTDRSYTVYASTTAITSTTGLTSLGSLKGATPIEIDPTKDYKYFWLQCTGGASYLNNITITYNIESSGGGEPETPATDLTDAQFAWSAATAEATMGATNTFPTLTNTVPVSVTYESSTPTTATIDATSGAITLVAPGTTTISATFAGGEVSGTTYAAKTVTYTLTVLKAPATPTGSVYVKVTDAVTDGEYLIVYEDAEGDPKAPVAFNGALTDLDEEKNTVEVTINSNTIAGNTDIDAATFTIDATAGSILSKSGYYIGNTTASNGLSSNKTTALKNEITLSEGTLSIKATDNATASYLKYNKASDQTRFRYYKSGQEAIALYKKASSHTLTYGTCTNGSVSASVASGATVLSGTTITLSNTPDTNYKLSAYDVYKTGDATTKVTVTDGKFVMPEFDVTISATFVPVKTLTSIEITTAATQTTFWQGETFNYTGLVITAHFTGAADEVVTPTVSGSTATAGTQTVTVSYTEGSVTKTATYTITVKAIPNTKETAYSVADAYDIIDKLTTAKGVFISGIISQVDSYNSTYKSITYWISADGTTTKQLEVYSGKGLESADFAAVTDLSVGDQVIICGNLKLYNEIYEFDKNNYLASHTPTTKDPAGLAYATTSYTANVGEAFTTPELTNPHNLVVTYSTSDASKATVNENTGAVTIIAAGTVTITASTMGDARHEPGSASYTITIVDPAMAVATLPFTFNSGKADIENTAGMTQNGLGSDYSANTAPNSQLKFDGTGDWVVIRFDSEPEKLSYDIKNNSFSGGTFSVQQSADGETYTDVEVHTEITNTQNEEHTLLSTSRYVKFIYTEKVDGNVGLGNIKITKPDPRQEAGIAWSTESIEITVGEDFTPPTLSNPNGLTLTCTSNNEDLVTVTNAGVITLKESVTGTAIITATFAGNKDYKQAEVSCTITVKALTTYTVTFDKNGHGTTTTQTINSGEKATEPKAPTATGYTFGGWYTEAECTNLFDFNTAITGHITLYAKWTLDTYTVTFDAGSGTYTSGDIQGNFETGLELPTATPCDYASTNGWSFVGWSETTISETTVRPAIHTGNYKPTKNITLHAVYAKTGTTQGAAGEFILSLQYEGTTYYVGQTFDNSKLSAETEQTNAARFTIEDNYLHYEGGYISHVSTSSSTNITRQANKEDAQAWTIAENGNTITFTSIADDTRGLGFNYNDGSPRFAAYKLNEKEKDGETIKYPSTFTKTSVSGGNVQVTTYNSTPSCKAPVNPTWQPATINFDGIIQVECGSKTLLNATDPNGPATITFNGYDLQNPVTVTASNGFLVSTDKGNDVGYKSEVTITPHKEGENIGKLQNVYVIAQAPAQSGNFTGTITLTGTDITDGSQVIKVTADVTCTTYTITWSVNGDTKLIDPTTFYAGGDWTLPENPTYECNGREFVGWTTDEILQPQNVVPTTLYVEKRNFPTIESDITFYAVFAKENTGDGNGTATVIDVLNRDLTGITETKYSNWSGKTATSSAVYAGNSAGGNSSIQLRTEDSNSGIVTTTSGGKAKEVTVVWNSNTSSGRTLNIYGKNSAYSAATDLYGDNAGTLIGSITYNTSTTITIDGDYEYIGIRSSNKPMYLTSIAITWETDDAGSGNATTYTSYTTSCADIKGIRIEGPTTTTFNEGDTFVFDGKVYAINNDDSETDVTNSPDLRFVYDMHKTGTQTVTVNYLGKSATYEITINAVEKWQITWNVSGATNTGLGPKEVAKETAIGTLPRPNSIPDGCNGYKDFVGWTESNEVNADGSNITYITSETVPSKNTTYYAVFATPSGSSGDGDYVKVTETPADFSGEYLIVYEDAKGDPKAPVAFNGGLTTLDAASNTISVTITDNTIKATDATNAAKFTITKSADGYTIKSASGYFIGQTTNANANGLKSSTTTYYSNNISINNDESAQVISGGTYLRYNNVSAINQGNQTGLRFRYFKSDTYTNQQPIALYKKSGSSASYTDYTTGCHDVTITYYGFTGGYTTNCDGSDLNVITTRVNSAHTIPSCADITDPTTLGRKFLNLWKDQDGKVHQPGETFIVTQDITLYAQWALNTESNITLPTDVEDLANTDIVVNGGNTLTLQAGTTTINSLTLKGGLQSNGAYAMPVINIPAGATLVRNSNKINLDLTVNNQSYYPFAVPFEVANTAANVNYINTTLKEYANKNNGYGKFYEILEYNGAGRAENGVHEANWVHVGRTDVKLVPGKGYAISAVPAAGTDTVTIRIAMTVSNDWLAGGEKASITVDETTTTRNQVTVTAHTGTATDINNGGHKRHAGWNFVANPYLANFSANENISGAGYLNGKLLIENGNYSYTTDEVPYVTIPTYNFAHYYQQKLSEATLSPAYGFFVQVGTGGTMSFAVEGRQQAPASIAARNAEERPVKMDVDITLSDNHSSDQTGIIISDRYSDAYEIGRDLEKLFGSANNLTVYTLMADNTPLAYQALAIRSNMQVIPVGYRTPAQGEYTFRLNEATSSIDLLNEQYEQLVLVDYQTGELTNLLISDYTFYSERTQADNRFAIYAVPRQNAPTDLPNAIGQDKQAQKIIHNGHLYILRDGNVYNGNGQIVK